MSVINGTTGPDVLDGTSGDDVINGLAGNDIINGGFGADDMRGNEGDDTYYVDDAGDHVTELNGQGTDTVRASVTFSLAGQYIENLTLIGSEHINATGNGYANLLIGNSGNNILDGATGADTMQGGAGDDTYYVDNPGDVAAELNGQGTDTVYSSADFSLAGQYLENLILTGTLGRHATGNSLANQITGNSGNNLLDGGQGADILTGGAGNDTYLVDNAGDQVVELAGGGIDTVTSSVNYSIAGQAIEALNLTGTAISATGNDLDNIINGNASANIIDGGAGADSLRGGAGDDTYYVDNAGDRIVEGSAAGNDTVVASLSYSIAGLWVENLTLSGGANINAVGNSLNNTLTGNSGNNLLNGNLGADTMNGGGGDDTYIVDNVGDVVNEGPSQGTDTVVTSLDGYFAGNNIENLTLTGSAVSGNGNGVNNVITGNALGNVLNGWQGADTLVGGAGDDTYWIDSAFDTVTETAGNGNDTVISWVTAFLSDNVENLFLTGSANIDGVGNALDNNIHGTSGNNNLVGGAGVDTMTGGAGHDTYAVDNVGDVVVENANEGIDTVNANVDYTLGDNIEKLVMGGTAVNGTGNALANMITGNNLNNFIDGGAGADSMYGGGGNDTYVISDVGDFASEQQGNGIDTLLAAVSVSVASTWVENITLTGSGNISATGNGVDNIIIGNDGDNYLDSGSAYTNHDTLSGNGGNDTIVMHGSGTASGGMGDDTYFVGEHGYLATVVENAGEGHDTVEVYGSYTLGDNLEDLVLIRPYDTFGGSFDTTGTGNALDNHITGDYTNNTLSGLDGSDVIDGGSGNDTITGGNGNDFLQGNSGLDEISGDDGNDTLEGGDSTDQLHGGNGEDNLTGGTGDDSLFGDADNDVLVGGDGVDFLNGGDGGDMLTGGAEHDVLVGGSGADQFIFEVPAGPPVSTGDDTINDYSTDDGDTLVLSGFTDFTVTQSGDDTVIQLQLGDDTDFATITLLNVDSSSQAFHDSIIWS